VLDLDYDRYAAAEACLGWLNLEGTLATIASPAEWARAFLHSVAEQTRAADAEVAHVKVWLETPGGSVRGNLVAGDEPALVTVQDDPAGAARVLVNARVAAPPDEVRAWIDRGIVSAGAGLDQPFTTTHLEAFSPSRPTPTHRLSPMK
jgi:hypothetical protein